MRGVDRDAAVRCQDDGPRQLGVERWADEWEPLPDAADEVDPAERVGLTGADALVVVG